jgi:hypothetical protein
MSDGNGRSGRGAVTTTGPRLARVRRSALPSGTSPEGLPARRRWARVAAGAVLALLGGWVFASLYVSAGERVEVIALSADVDRFAEIERGDLRMVRVAADPGVDTVSGGDVDEIVGRQAAVDLVEGSLLTDAQVLPRGERIVGDDEAIVGAELAPGDAPQSALVGGVDVRVVMRPSATASASAGAEAPEATRVDGWLLQVGEPDENTRARPVELVVPEGDSAAVQAAAAEERLSLVVLEG